MSRLRARIIGIAVVSACGFTASNMQRDDATSPIDSSVDAYIPDASACLRGSAECIANGQMIRVCDGPGLQPHDEPCSWSCLSTPEAHCAKLVPSGGAVTTADLDPTTLGDVTITAAPTATLDTDTGAISNGVRPAGIGSIMNGIEVTQRGNVTVFRMSKLTVNGVLLRITGTRAAALVSLTDITINAEIDVQGDCAARTAGPGGFPAAARAPTAAAPAAVATATASPTIARVVAAAATAARAATAAAAPTTRATRSARRQSPRSSAVAAAGVVAAVPRPALAAAAAERCSSSRISASRSTASRRSPAASTPAVAAGTPATTAAVAAAPGVRS